ncbi:MAG: hypothetical protein J6S67_03610 [Methanobrevibacter sp.]|nr:hypothetical protein [Methanobrevibacter sp.]
MNVFEKQLVMLECLNDTYKSVINMIDNSNRMIDHYTNKLENCEENMVEYYNQMITEYYTKIAAYNEVLRYLENYK